MKIQRATVIAVVVITAASCSEKPAPDRKKDSETKRESEAVVARNEEERQPREDEIAEDCVAFVRSTKIVPAQAPTADCPGCPAPGAEVLVFQRMKMDRVSCSGDACTVVVTLRVTFKPGIGEKIAGGLTAWISPEQRSACLSGQSPAGEQAYRVQITYKREGEHWRAIEFDRVPAD